MTFIELEKIMISKGISSLAEIARALNTTPQAVSNWKARDQVPYHVVIKLNQPKVDYDESSQAKPKVSRFNIDDDTISLSDIFVTLAEQLKVIVIMPLITLFITFTYFFTFNQSLYESSSKILLPENQVISGGLAGIASQFGVNLPQGGTADLSSPSLFPELVKSYTFAETILEETFYVEEFQKELSLLAILTHGIEKPTEGRDTLVRTAISAFHEMISFENEGSFSVLRVKSSEPKLARDINIEVLDKLESLNRYFKSQNVSEKIQFIQSRIEAVGNDLEESEKLLKSFREKNRQVSSPSLQMEQERLSRDVDIQKGIFLTLKQELELAKIEKIQNETIVQVLDPPQVPLSASESNMLLGLFLAGVFGISLGVLLGFFRSYINQGDIDERRKIRRVRNFIKKKSKDIFFDHRIAGIGAILLLFGLPFYLGHESKVPIYFGMYSARLMIVNIIYIITLIFCIVLFIYNIKKKK